MLVATGLCSLLIRNQSPREGKGVGVKGAEKRQHDQRTSCMVNVSTLCSGVWSSSRAQRGQGAGTQHWLLVVSVSCMLTGTSPLSLPSQPARKVVLFPLEM